jgi:hypothetical protein
MRMAAIALITVVSCVSAAAWAQGPADTFPTSLHHTGAGMQYWYEKDDGFKTITGVPYAETGCNQCHVPDCGKCHTESDAAKVASGDTKPKQMDTCLVCHQCTGFVIKSDEAAGIQDVHRAAGLVCADCHKGDTHGDGTQYHSMRDPGAVKITCLTCHETGANNATKFDATTRSHTVHKGKLDCTACHVSSSAMCYNCHFDQYMATGKKEGNFIPTRGATFLMNCEEGDQTKVVSATAQPLVGKGKTFVAIGPYYTHSIMKKGRACPDCHANEAVMAMKSGGKFAVAEFEGGTLSVHQGVIPVVDGQLEWVFLDKTDSGWSLLPNAPAPAIQYVAHGKPLDSKQMTRLGMPLKK